MKKITLEILIWIDNNINHKFIDKLFDKFISKDYDKFNLVYWIWVNTSRRYCNFVFVTLESWCEERYE